MKKLLLVIIFIYGGCILADAQKNSIIRGKITDNETGEELIGATVIVKGTSWGAAADLDGNYTVRNLTPGTYDLQISYLSYETKIINTITIASGEIKIINVSLLPTGRELTEVAVSAKITQKSESSLLRVKKKSVNVIDAISSEAFSRNGSGDVGSAMNKVTGVSVENGKYVYVRGLGDRYTKTALNGADIPGLDPERNSVQMDLFPTNLIDNVIVYKNFSPDLPGDFTGGYVDITTKDFPNTLTFKISSGTGINTSSHFGNRFLTYNGGKTDWLGTDDGTRNFPEAARAGIPDKGANNPLLTDITKAFNKELDYTTKSPFLNHNHSISFGNQADIFGKQLGFIGSFGYSRKFEAYRGGTTGRFKLTDDDSGVLNEELFLEDEKGTEQVLWGGMLGATAKLTDFHKIGLTFMRNQSGEKTTRFQEGRKPSDAPELFYQTRALLFEERKLTSVQAKGEHVFGTNHGLKIDWHSAYTLSEIDQPDLRFFTNGFVVSGENIRTYSIEPSIGQIPTRYTRSMREYNYDHKLNIEIPFKQWNGLTVKLKTGAAYLYKYRTFRESQFKYDQDGTDFSGDPAEYVSDDNIWTVNNTSGVFIVDAFDPRNSYNADRQTIAGYIMADLPVTEQLHIVTGARMELSDTYFTSLAWKTDPQLSDLNNKRQAKDFDILPAFALNYGIGENMNLRASYGRTLARPSFRELAPFASFEFIGDFIKVGNDELQRTLIDNTDIRWEYFLQPGELISAGLFYKNFKDPIEITYNPAAPNTEITFRNAERSQVYGIELEVRKSLGFISESLNKFGLGANITLVKSVTDIAPAELEEIKLTDPEASSTRAMFGQSPYIINTYFDYQNERGTSARIGFNVQGERLAVVLRGGTPNVFEQPRPDLNITFSQRFAKSWNVKISASNLINAAFKQTQELAATEYIYQSYRTGRTFSLGLSYAID